MRLFVNTDQQLLTEVAGTSQAVQLLSTPRSANVPLILQFTQNGQVYEPDPVDLTVADEAERFHLAEGTAQTITTSSLSSSACVISAAAHGMLTGDSCVISGNADTAPDINGTHVITYIDENSFSIPVVTTVGGTGGTATKLVGASLGQFILQTDTLDRWKVISVADLDSVAGYLASNLTIKWLVKETLKFDGPAMAMLTDFAKSGTGSSTQYKGFVNYITTGINTALHIDSSTTNDVEQVFCMAQISWDGIDSGKTGWINHAIRNDLTRDEDVVPAQLGVKYAKTAIVNGNDFVEVTFGVPYNTANWHFVGSPVISNLIDATPLGIMVVGLTSRSGTGFTIKLSTAVDTSNYKLEWVAALD